MELAFCNRKTCPTYLSYRLSLDSVLAFSIKFNVYGSVHREYILIYIQKYATLHSLFISENCSTCFGWYHHPSSGTHTTVSTASGICHTVTATCRYRSNTPTIAAGSSVKVWQIPDAVDTVVCAADDGWRYHPKHVERFPDMNKVCKVASCWIYIGIHYQLNTVTFCVTHLQ